MTTDGLETALIPAIGVAILAGGAMAYARRRASLRWVFRLSLLVLITLTAIPVTVIARAALYRPAASQVALANTRWTIESIDGSPVMATIRFRETLVELETDCRVLTLSYWISADDDVFDVGPPDASRAATCSARDGAVVDALLDVEAWHVESQDAIVLSGLHTVDLVRMSGRGD